MIIAEMEPLYINGWTIRACDDDGFDLMHGDERYHHDRLEVAVVAAQRSPRGAATSFADTVREGKNDLRSVAAMWVEELKRDNSEALARRVVLEGLLARLDRADETNRRLNHRAQEADSLASVIKKAVGEWEMEDGRTYVPLRTLATIAKAAGQPVDEPHFKHHGDKMRELEARLDRYEKNKPSWAHGTPEDYDAWLRDLTPDDRRLKFYQWIGRSAVNEAIGDVRQSVDDDPTPVEHRYYSPQGVHEFLDGPEEGGPYPAKLPLGRRFCDVDHHAHIDGGGRLPTCRLDSEE